MGEIEEPVGGFHESQSNVSEELNRDIGLPGALAIGTMIAAGVFVLSGLAVGNVGAMAIVYVFDPDDPDTHEEG